MALPSMASVLRGLFVWMYFSCGSTYVLQLKSQRQNAARFMYQEPTTNRDQFFRGDVLKFTGAALASVLLLPLASKAAIDTSVGISDIAITYDGVSKPIGEYLGSKGTLIVNVASQCALTPQYDDLVTLYNKYKQDGFTILAFPCNQFGSQEPQSEERIRKEMKKQFGVEFPIFDKIEVNGGGSSPLYVKLKAYEGLGTSTDSIKKVSWNFEKFLVDPKGMPVRRYLFISPLLI
jgi:glutathione peroxidase